MNAIVLLLLFTQATKVNRLPVKLIDAVCYTESRYKASAIHHDDGGGDSLGICQIKLATAKGMGFKGTAKELMSPAINIKYASKYLSHQMKRYHGNITKAIIAYNQGSAKNLTSTKYSVIVLKRLKEVTKK